MKFKKNYRLKNNKNEEKNYWGLRVRGNSDSYIKTNNWFRLVKKIFFSTRAKVTPREKLMPCKSVPSCILDSYP